MASPRDKSPAYKNINFSELLHRLSINEKEFMSASVGELEDFLRVEDQKSRTIGKELSASCDKQEPPGRKPYYRDIPKFGSPAQFQDANSLDSSAGSSSIPFSFGLRSPGKVSPLRGRTMKEYEEQLGNLKKENFSLKLRIYFLEEKMGQKYDKEDKEGLYKTNIELKVEAEALKRELCEKQDLVRQASTALTGLEQQYQDKVAQMKIIHEQEKDELQEKIEQLQKNVNEYAERVREGGSQLGELTQLCGLAFSTGTEDENHSVLGSSQDTMNLPLQFPKSSNSFLVPSPMQGLFSMPTLPSSSSGSSRNSQSLVDAEDTDNTENTKQRVASLQAKVAELEERVTELEGELAAKEETNNTLKGDLANLENELVEKLEKIGELEAEVSEKDMKIDDVMQELETRHMEIKAKEDEIETLTQGLIKAEPEIEVKVQEIVERDRIIEEKIEQIEQQNKILVEIQITLDEKQKQIADMEHKISESTERIKKLTEEQEKSLKVIQAFAEEVEARDKEIASLKKEVKRKEKKIRDLVAELKEALDMLNKAKWEAETSGGEDGVKEMAEEENERLWAELESRKNEVLAMRADHKHALSEAETRIKNLQDKLDELTKSLEGEKEKRNKEVEERESRLQEQAQQVAQLEIQLQALHGDVSNREGQLRSNQDLVQELKGELASAKEMLKEKKAELEGLQDELRKKNADMQDLVNHELWERNKEVEKLQEKLTALTADRQQQVESMRGELESKNKEVRNLKTRLGTEENEAVADTPKVIWTYPNNSQVVTIPTGDQPKNATHLTVIANSGGADVVNVSRPLHLNLADDSYASVQMLYQEMSKIRSEAQALRLERTILNDKLSNLQKWHEQVSKTTDAAKANELHEQINCVRKQLEESKEENVQKEQKHGEVVCDFQVQVQTLRNELHSAKKKINKQLTEVSARKYHETLKRHKQEIASLRKRLADSHNACDLLRTRLEELADFLERILEMDEKGLINLSQLSPKQLASLHKTLNESRALSRSLSQSLMIGMESIDHGDDTLLSSSVSSVSSWSLHREDSLSETHDPLGASSHEAIASLPDDSILPPEDSHDPAVQALATQLNTQIDQKTREIDAIAENVCALSEQLAERTRQVEQQAGVIGELRGQVGRLQDEVRSRDLQLMVSHADPDQGSVQSNLHGSWQSSINPLAASSQSTVHASSPQTTVHAHDSSSQELLRNSPSTCSDTLPPPPLHLLQDSECEDMPPGIREMEICHTSDRSSLSAVKSAYSTDAAIKAYSGHPGYFQQLTTPSERSRLDRPRSWGENGNAAAGCIVPEQPWAPVSPSESEAWSEPDRNVSLARIGLDACTLGGAPDRALSRSRQQRASAAITSESDGDAAQDDTTTCTANPSSTPGKTPKRRSDIAELRRVSTKLRAVEQLNDTLRAELNIYQTLSQQMASQDNDHHQRPKTSDKSVETHKGETADASVGAEDSSVTPPLPVFTVPAPLMEEIRALRLKLEEAISNNDHLRDQLEAALTAHPQDEARFHHLTAALQTAQEEVRDARDRFQGSQEIIHEQQEQFNKLQLTVQSYESQVTELHQQLEDTRKETAFAKLDLGNAQQIIKEKDNILQQCNSQITENEQIIKEYIEKVFSLERAMAKNPDSDSKVKELELELQNQEARLLHVNKERLSLVGERASLQAKLASVSTQARLLQDDQQDDDSIDKEKLSLHGTVTALQEEVQKLESENQELKRQLEKFHLRHDLMKSSQTNTSIDVEQDKVRLQADYAALQQVFVELQLKSKQQEQQLSSLMEKKKLEDTSNDCLLEQRTLIKQLTAQLESERCLTSNLQLRLDALRATESPSISHAEDCDLASPVSVTSIEFFRPVSQDASELRNRRQTSLGPPSSLEKEKVKERRASSASRKRDATKRLNTHWSEDKENLYTTTTTITTTTTSSKQGRHYSVSNNNILTNQAAILPRQPDDEVDGGTTSGESPDLGIGSDYHFSSLERGTHTLRSVVQPGQDLPPPSLCSEPSHSTLTAENQRLRQERDSLTGKLVSTKQILKDTLDKLSKANQRKECVERAICKQLTKTHNVLKKAKGPLKQPNSLPQ
ncbi:CDK5 regulatory subunit-associated protein 2-like isoform X2 [Palaemon carinicauda]|uniref:CDK5 regulatory subunit-associated protein 2-like isoform X2 n=1 Tax=Palaemon carinicauda TaxID=392227 RepID=UPI0035B65DB4